MFQKNDEMILSGAFHFVCVFCSPSRKHVKQNMARGRRVQCCGDSERGTRLPALGRVREPFLTPNAAHGSHVLNVLVSCGLSTNMYLLLQASRQSFRCSCLLTTISSMAHHSSANRTICVKNGGHSWARKWAELHCMFRGHDVIQPCVDFAVFHLSWTRQPFLSKGK